MDDGAVISSQKVIGRQSPATPIQTQLKIPPSGNHFAFELWTGNGATGYADVLPATKGRLAQHDRRSERDSLFKYKLHLGHDLGRGLSAQYGCWCGRLDRRRGGLRHDAEQY